MTQFITDYIASLTGFSFEKSVIERIALERNVQDVNDIADLTQRDKDLLTADLLYTAFFSPAQTASISKKHGAYSVTIGSQYISHKSNIYREMMRLYRKWGEDKMLDADNGGLQWME